MIRTFYKSLDKPSSLLGIQGTYKKYAVVGIVVSALIGVIVASATVGLIGFIVFAALAICVYLGILRFQSRFSERERDKMLASRQLPDFVIMPSTKLSSLSARKITEKEGTR